MSNCIHLSAVNDEMSIEITLMYNQLISILFQYLDCEVESVTYTQIVCETNCLSSPANCRTGAMTATVMVPVGDGSVMAQCEDPSCTFITSDDKTPTVSDVSPVTTNAGMNQRIKVIMNPYI